MARILITGAGGPAAIGIIRRYEETGHDVFAADMSEASAGLFMVPERNRLLIPPGKSHEFVPVLVETCRRLAVDILIPTVDCELVRCARAEAEFKAIGTALMTSPPDALEVCLDKYALLRRVESVVPVGKFALYDESFQDSDWQFPLVVKPRTGSGSRGVLIIHRPAELAVVPKDGSHLVQEYLPGEEYSVDVLSTNDGEVRACVPRERVKQDSGVAVVARTLHDLDLESYARLIAQRLGLKYVSNIQFRRDRKGVPVLLEVNARFPGTNCITVGAGIDMPVLALNHALGCGIPENLEFREVEMVRYLQEQILSKGALQRTRSARWFSDVPVARAS